jgi:ribosomal protein S18 acetylase RimI-like enzyme
VPPVNIRECKPEDFEAIFSLFEQLWPNREFHKEIFRNIYQRQLTAKDDQFRGAEVDGKIVGFISFSTHEHLWSEGKVLYINEIIMDRSFRGKGIGSALMNKTAELAKSQKCKVMRLDSSFSRTEAHEFFLKNGFEKKAYLFYKEL